MSKYRNKLSWAKRTFTGYEAMFVTPDKSYIIRHKFLRQPEMLTTGHDDLRGRQFGVIYFDEWTDEED